MTPRAKASRTRGTKTTPAARRAPAARRPAERRPKGTVQPAPVSSGLAPGMQAINTYLAVANIAASMTFFERAFGFTRGVVLQDEEGRPRYAELRHGDSVVMLVHKGDSATPTNGAAALYTYVPDVDRAVAQARDAGAGVADAEDQPWGDRAAVITDPDGYRWVLATFRKLAAF